MALLNPVKPRKREKMRYDDYIRALANENSSLIVRHDRSDYASIIKTEIFRHAKTEVKIYDDYLHDNICGLSNSYDKSTFKFAHLYDFFSSGKSLKILLRNGKEPYSEIYYALTEYDLMFPNKIEIKFLEKNQKNQKSIRNQNFIVSDNNAFSLELEVKENASTIVKAVTCFNDDSNATKLNNAFNAQYQNTNQKIDLISPLKNG